MACIATWSFGIEAVQSAVVEVKQEKSCVDVVESAVNVVEDDPSTGCYYVGRGCYPNREGVVQLDAAIMRGRDGSFGSVAALERYAKPISVARRLLEHPSLCMLVGTGATQFAKEQGFTLQTNDELLTQETLEAYKNFKLKNMMPPSTGHDTLSVLALDTSGGIAAGVSTSGPPFKPCGRVGDSPLPGCGLYADDDAGAAAATGDGEQIMKFCPSFKIVQLMKEGLSPQAACEEVVRNMKERSKESFEIGVIALDTKGDGGAATTVNEFIDCRDEKVYQGFPYSYWKYCNSDHKHPTITTQPPL